MNYEALKYKIGITLIKGIGNNLAKNLIAYLGSEEAVFGEKQQNLAKIPGIGEVLSREIVKQDVLRRAEEEVEFVVKNKITPYYFSDREYPFRLKECPEANFKMLRSDSRKYDVVSITCLTPSSPLVTYPLSFTLVVFRYSLKL